MTLRRGPARVGPETRNGRRDASPLRPFEVQRAATRGVNIHLMSRGSVATVAGARSFLPEHSGVVARTADGAW
jgi:hypothetical protein